jgi:GR25 family glycosyltransferase involved in LPS biosynthesis
MAYAKRKSYGVHTCHMSCWDFLDKIYCITLEHRNDRRRRSEIQFARVGLLDRVEYVQCQPHPLNSEQGIYESHMHCVQKGLESNAQRIAIFEDDVVFDKFDPERVIESVRFLNRLDQWGILFLGCLVSRSYPTSSSVVRRIRYRSLAHAYILNRPSSEKLAKIQWSGKPFDAILQRFVRDSYAIYPSIAFQSNASSDNYRLKGLERFRRLCGGLGLIQKMNERYHRNFKAILLLHLLAALAVAGWLL